MVFNNNYGMIMGRSWEIRRRFMGYDGSMGWDNIKNRFYEIP